MQTKNITEILTFLQRTKQLETALRYRDSMRGAQNSVAEHSWRLGLMALVIARECGVTINMEHTLELALMHDLAEAYTGDVDAYTQIKEGSFAAAHIGNQLIPDKTLLEDDAMRTMTGDLSFGTWVYDLWREYEEQQTTEAKFVKALDKIEGFLHIAEVGLEAYVPKEFHGDYANKAVAAFDEASHHFPNLVGLLEAVKLNLKTQCEKAGVEWIDSR
jgi:putative hydrolases of HD superfamily